MSQIKKSTKIYSFVAKTPLLHICEQMSTCGKYKKVMTTIQFLVCTQIIWAWLKFPKGFVLEITFESYFYQVEKLFKTF